MSQADIAAIQSRVSQRVLRWFVRRAWREADEVRAMRAFPQRFPPRRTSSRPCPKPRSGGIFAVLQPVVRLNRLFITMKRALRALLILLSLRERAGVRGGAAVLQCLTFILRGWRLAMSVTMKVAPQAHSISRSPGGEGWGEGRMPRFRDTPLSSSAGAAGCMVVSAGLTWYQMPASSR